MGHRDDVHRWRPGHRHAVQESELGSNPLHGTRPIRVVFGGMSRLISRPAILAATLVLTVIALLRFGVLATILVMAVGVTTAVLVGRHRGGLFRLRVRARGRREPVWKPKNHHVELPAPADDPVTSFAEPVVELFASRTPPLAHLPPSAAVRSELDGFALGRTRRIVDAPDPLSHAAAHAESWPFVETTVQKTLALA